MLFSCQGNIIMLAVMKIYVAYFYKHTSTCSKGTVQYFIYATWNLFFWLDTFMLFFTWKTKKCFHNFFVLIMHIECCFGFVTISCFTFD